MSIDRKAYLLAVFFSSLGRSLPLPCGTFNEVIFFCVDSQRNAVLLISNADDEDEKIEPVIQLGTCIAPLIFSLDILLGTLNLNGRNTKPYSTDMYKAFKISAQELYKIADPTLPLSEVKKLSEHKKLFEKSRKDIITHLQGNPASLDAALIWDTCFPAIKADVFISHSSLDKKLAQKLKWYLYHHCGLESFIDSEVWDYYKSLLKDLNDTYSRSRGKLDYDACLTIANMVHAMLSYALSRMIDQTECFCFIGSTNSTTEDKEHTYSPWIFHELVTANTISPRPPERHSRMVNLSEGHIKSAAVLQLPKFKFPLFTEHLIPITYKDLVICYIHNKLTSEHPLNRLYDLTQSRS